MEINKFKIYIYYILIYIYYIYYKSISISLKLQNKIKKKKHTFLELPVLENATSKFMDFPGIPGPLQTLSYAPNNVSTFSVATRNEMP